MKQYNPSKPAKFGLLYLRDRGWYDLVKNKHE